MNEINPLEQQPETPKPNLFKRALQALWRIFLLLLTGILVGAVIYFAFIQLYVNAVQVGQTSALRLNMVETASALQRQQDAERLDQLSKRLAEAEKQQGQQSESISDLQGKTILLNQSMERLNAITKRVATLEASLVLNTQNDVELNQAVTADDSPVMVTRREVKTLKAMGLISRARLNLMQNNAGLARSDVTAAYQLLEVLKTETPEAQKPIVDTWIQRLGLVLENLPAYPVVAADDLEIAWSMLTAGMDSPLPTISPNTMAPSPTTGVETPLITPAPPIVTTTPDDLTPAPAATHTVTPTLQTTP